MLGGLVRHVEFSPTSPLLSVVGRVLKSKTVGAADVVGDADGAEDGA